MNNEWRCFVEYRPSVVGTFLYVCQRLDSTHTQFLIKGGEKIVTVDPSSHPKEDVYYARFEDAYIGQLIVEALDKHGIKAPAQSFVEGKLQATEKHLEDMRSIVGHDQKINLN
jgi:DNA-binding LacI/PurR family transcriptional regulator